jgi:hypothetical protein
MALVFGGKKLLRDVDSPSSSLQHGRLSSVANGAIAIDHVRAGAEGLPSSDIRRCSHILLGDA